MNISRNDNLDETKSFEIDKCKSKNRIFRHEIADSSNNIIDKPKAQWKQCLRTVSYILQGGFNLFEGNESLTLDTIVIHTTFSSVCEEVFQLINETFQ